MGIDRRLSLLYFYSFPSKFWGIGYDMGKVDANESDLDRWQDVYKRQVVLKLVLPDFVVF